MQSRFRGAALLFVLLFPAFSAGADDKSLVFFPLANLGISYPNGFEATAGVLFGSITDDVIKGPTASIRLNLARATGVSVGPGYVEQLTLGGYGVNLWFSQNFSPKPSGNSVSIEGYIRLLLFEARVGVLVFGEAEEKPLAIFPIAGINFGL